MYDDVIAEQAVMEQIDDLKKRTDGPSCPGCAGREAKLKEIRHSWNTMHESLTRLERENEKLKVERDTLLTKRLGEANTEIKVIEAKVEARVKEEMDRFHDLVTSIRDLLDEYDSDCEVDTVDFGDERPDRPYDDEDEDEGLGWNDDNPYITNVTDEVNEMEAFIAFLLLDTVSYEINEEGVPTATISGCRVNLTAVGEDKEEALRNLFKAVKDRFKAEQGGEDQ
jgi:regulator of replication initiation timing